MELQRNYSSLKYSIEEHCEKKKFSSSLPKNYIQKDIFNCNKKIFTEDNFSDDNSSENDFLEKNFLEINFLNNSIENKELDLSSLSSNNLGSNDLDPNNLDFNNLDSNILDSNNLGSNNLGSNNLGSNNLDSNNLDSNNLDSNNLDFSSINKNLIKRNFNDQNEIINGKNNEADLSDISENSDASSLVSIPSKICLLERLIRTHPIWLLTNLERSAVTHLLQGKEPGTFIVRNSSKSSTMALSVRLPEKDNLPYIEHYLIENLGNRKIHLEGSKRLFSAIPMLVYHYCQNCIELPICLKLPEVILNANRHQLNSLSELGDGFWKNDFECESFSNLKLDKVEKRKKEKSFLEKNETKEFFSKKEILIKEKFMGKKNIFVSEEENEYNDSDYEFQKKDIYDSYSDGEKLDKISNHSDTNLKKQLSMIDNHENNEEKNIETNNEPCIPERPPRKDFLNLNVSPPPIPSRATKPSTKNYTKDFSETNFSTNDKKKEDNNLNSLIDFDVFKEEEELINQLKEENDIYNLNAINAQTQQLMSSSQFSNKNESNSSFETDQKDNQPLCLTNNFNVTKIKVNLDTKIIEDNLQSTSKIILEKNELENNSQVSSKKDSFNSFNSSHDNEAIIKKKDTKNNLNRNCKECGVQTTQKQILKDLKLEKYKNFLIYDYAPNLKSSSFSMMEDSIYVANDENDLLFYQHFLNRNCNSSNPNLNFNNPLAKTNETHSFESLYVTYDSVSSKHQFFFERYIVPRNSKLSDVCLQVGDGIVNFDDFEEDKVKQEKKKKSSKDLAWQVDSSWEWQSSDEEELTSSLAVKKSDIPLSSKYRRFSCKHVIESGVDTDSEIEIISHKHQKKKLNDQLKNDNYDNLSKEKSLCSKQKIPIKKNSPLLTLDSEEPCSSGFWETKNNELNKLNKLQSLKNNNSETKSFVNQINCLNNSKIEEVVKTEDEEEEMVFQEIGLDDIYTTNDELYDDNNSLDNVLEDPYSFKNKNLEYSQIAKSISTFIFNLFKTNDNTFSKSIKNFIQCTQELNEPNPLVIMRNVRQFMNGIKNYLIKNGEKEFLTFVKKEKKNLKCEEFINLDAIIEGCLHKLIIKPLKDLIKNKFTSKNYKYGYESYQKLKDNFKFLNCRLPEEFEIKPNFKFPNNQSMKRIKIFFEKLKNTYSPLKKMEYILCIVSIINLNSKLTDKNISIENKLMNRNTNQIDEKTFVLVFIYILIKFNITYIEPEIDYIWSLLQPNLIYGDAGYYLNVITSCVYILKINFRFCGNFENPLNLVDIQKSLITSFLPTSNDSLNAKCRLKLFNKEITNNLVFPKIIDHSDLSLKNSKNKSFTFNQNLATLNLVNSNFVQSYPSALSNFRQENFFMTNNLNNTILPTIRMSSLFSICCLKVLILDEFTGNINSKIVIIRPEMSLKEFIKLLAFKFSVINSEDYSLFLLNQEGNEFLVDENELPFSIKINSIKHGINLSFVYRRTESQYIWPDLTQSEYFST